MFQFFNKIANSPLNKSFSENMIPLLLTIRGSFQGYYGNTVLAFKHFSSAFLKTTRPHQADINWKCIIEDNLNYYSADNKETLPDNFITNLNKHEILENAWIQWGTLIQNYFTKSGNKDMSLGLSALECFIIATKFTSNIKYNILVAKVCMKLLQLRIAIIKINYFYQILWLLICDDDKCTLLNLFKKNNNFTLSDFWITQILNIFVEKNQSTIQQIFSKVIILWNNL